MGGGVVEHRYLLTVRRCVCVSILQTKLRDGDSYFEFQPVSVFQVLESNTTLIEIKKKLSLPKANNIEKVTSVKKNKLIV